MGLPEDIHSLQDLHEKGKLTDQEFADAKVAIIKKYQKLPVVGRSSSLSVRPGFVLILLLVLFLLLGIIWYKVGTKKTSETIAPAVHAPIEVENEVENLPAASWKAITLSLPYSGTVSVNLQVVRGNPINVLLAMPDQLETIQKGQWNQVRVYRDFTASKTKSYKRSGQVPQGDYYLVLRDTSLGILSSTATDITIKVQLSP